MKYLQYFLLYVPYTTYSWMTKEHGLCPKNTAYGRRNRYYFLKEDLKVGWNSLFHKPVSQEEVEETIKEIKSMWNH